MQNAAKSRPANLSRRAALKAIGASIGTVVALPYLSDEGLIAFVRIQETNAAPQLRALSPLQFGTLEVLVDAIIPTDERSPGAKQARVADYIDLLLSEADRGVTLAWFGGLAALDAEAVSRFRAPFGRLGAPQVDAILQTISRNERAPQTALETFFVMVKQATVNGYYTSKIGIHEDLRYKGNVFIREFVGCQTEDGKDCSHCGQKHL
jgi:glucoside 3-dehydrogenase (cytochrome c) hitch-hiker subunit